MADPIDSLVRLTPTSAVSRDTVLFAAGRASVSFRVWKLACFLLAGSQILTLVLLWPKSEIVAPPEVPIERGISIPEGPVQRSPLDFVPTFVRGDRRQRSADEPIPSSMMVSSPPTLTAGSRILPN